MAPSQSEKGLFEKGFDEDLPREKLERILELFPTPEKVTDLLLQLRDADGFTDMKRGELYPEIIGGVTRLRRTIAGVYGVDTIQAHPNFSCNGCIDTFLSFIQRLELTDSRRNGLLVTTPTYFRYYHKVEALRMRMLGVADNPDHSYPKERVLQALRDERPSCFFVVTPNNPTGVPISDEDLIELLDQVPDDVYVAIDRTCANIEPEISTKALLERYPHKNVVVFHSFSKYYGMSHSRIGFSLFSNPAMASEVNRYLPFGLNLEALLTATYILITEGELRPSERILGHIRQNREIMADFLSRHGDYACTDFKSNYALLFLPERVSSRRFYEQLMKRGIFVMPGHDFPDPSDRFVRIHTGGEPRFLQQMLDLIETW